LPAAISPTLTVTFGSALAFGAGIGTARFIPLPAAACATLSLLGGTVFLFMKAQEDTLLAAGPGISAGLVLAWACTGAWSATLRHRQFVDSPLLKSFTYLRLDPPATLIVRGWVADDPVRRDERVRFLFSVEEGNRYGSWRPSNGVVRVSLRDPEGSFRAGYGDRFECHWGASHGQELQESGSL
jgi:hypothetical protein